MKKKERGKSNDIAIEERVDKTKYVIKSQMHIKERRKFTFVRFVGGLNGLCEPKGILKSCPPGGLIRFKTFTLI